MSGSRPDVLSAWLESGVAGLERASDHTPGSPLSTEEIRRCRQLAKGDAAARPLRTPCLVRWRQLGAKPTGPVWRAAGWEAAALDTRDPEHRISCFARAREIIAVAQRAKAA